MIRRHFHSISGGGGSWLSAKVDIGQNPDLEHRFIFADTLYEDADGYRFLIEGVANLLDRRLNWSLPSAADFPDYRVDPAVPIEEYQGNPEWRAFLAQLREDATRALPELIWIVEGRDPWEVFRDERLLGSNGFDPCSKILKRRELERWRKANCDPATDAFTVGIGPDEAHRFDDGKGGGLYPRMAAQGWTYLAPLIGTIEGAIGPLVYLEKAGIDRPRLYRMGYMHNNCGGFCCKAGHAHYRNRLRVHPDRFAYDKLMEQKMRDFLGANVSMMRTTAGGKGKQVFTLAELEELVQRSPEIDFDWLPGESGCGCMIDEGGSL